MIETETHGHFIENLRFLEKKYGKDNLTVLFRGIEKRGEVGLWWTDDLLTALDYAIGDSGLTSTKIANNLRVIVIPNKDLEELLESGGSKRPQGGFINYKLPNLQTSLYPYRALTDQEVDSLKIFFDNGDFYGNIKREFSSTYSTASTKFSRELII